MILKLLGKLLEFWTPVIAEGNINTPSKVRRVLQLGVHTVVVGSAITRPLVIAKPFIEATNID